MLAIKHQCRTLNINDSLGDLHYFGLLVRQKTHTDVLSAALRRFNFNSRIVLDDVIFFREVRLDFDVFCQIFALNSRINVIGDPTAVIMSIFVVPPKFYVVGCFHPVYFSSFGHFTGFLNL